MEDSRQERLSEEEPWDPEVGRSSLIDPFLHELESFDEVIDVASQRFQAWIGNFEEQIRHFVIEDTVENNLKFLTHDNEPVDGLIDID